MNKTLFRLALFAVLLTGISLAVFYRDSLNIEAIQNWVEQSGVLAPLVFMLVYILATVFFLPGSVLTLAGGALFGPVMGVFYNLTAATLGAILAFLAARYLASDWVAKKSAGRLKTLITGVENEGWRFVAFVRLVPLFPFNLLNYALGLTRIKLLDYSLATYICMFPGAVAYTYLGYIGREAATGGEGLIQKMLLGLALLALVAFIPRFIKQMRMARQMISAAELKQRLENKEDLLLLDVRSEEDYYGEQGCIEGSILIPVEQLNQKLPDLKMQLNNKETPIITICRTDRKSSKAAEILSEHGFRHVQIVKMGMTDWIKQGFSRVIF